MSSRVYAPGVHSSAAPSSATDIRVPRHKVFLPAEVIGLSGTTRIHLLNLSLTGALAHGEPMAAPGSVVQLRCGTTSWLARIVWVRDKRFGMVHVVPLAPGVVATLIAGPRG